MTTNQKIIEPKILKGTRDFLPLDMAKRNLVMNKIRNIFRRFGYDQIETPILCPAETILGKYGEEGEKLTYNFRTKGDTAIALPYDLTVPFARLFAANWRELPLPFKRYQIQRVWRAEKPQKGRLREFYQCDIDVIGTKSLIAEAEIAKMIVTVFQELGFKSFKLKINSRRLINAVLGSFGIAEKEVSGLIRILDKVDKIGLESVEDELKKNGLKEAQKILDLLQPEGTNTLTLEKLSAFDTSELEQFLSFAKSLGIDEGFVEINPLLARGLDYYTGIIYELVDLENEFGALCGGGRYDNLCGLFCKESFSGVGVAFGFERIMMVLEERGDFENVRLNSQVLVALFDNSLAGEALKIYDELLAAGISSEIYFEATKVAKQFKYADKKNIPFVVIAGPDEIAKEEVTVKYLKVGKQKTIPRKQLASYLLNFYENEKN